MRLRFRTARVLLALAALAAASAATEAAAKRRPKSRTASSIHLSNGLYAIPDRQVTCKIVGDRMSCTNGQVLIACSGYVCTPHIGPLDYEDAMAIHLEDEESPARKVLALGIHFEIGQMGCWVRRAYIDCELSDARGGFQMSGLFVRNTNIVTAPPGWPRDGRHYTYKDGFPFPL
jgi:hypothetical protein